MEPKWNLENLFCPGGAAGPRDGPAYEAKLTALAKVVTSLAPDVLAVQEVGDPEALSDLADLVGGQWSSALADPDGRGIRVGYLSRLDLRDLEQTQLFPTGLSAVQVDDTSPPATGMGRPALRARVHAPAANGQPVPVDLLTCHLKSKLLTFPGGRFDTRDEHERARYAAADEVQSSVSAPRRRPARPCWESGRGR